MSDADMNRRGGPTAWMLRNPVAANLLMLFLLIGGALSLPLMQREVFPDAKLNAVNIIVPYPGATPSDVEEGVLLPIESAVRGIDGVDTIRSIASEGQGSVVAELEEGVDANVVLNDIESQVNRITSMPPRAEEPLISIPSNQVQVLNLILYGDIERTELDRFGQQIRNDLLRLDSVAKVEVQGIPPPEISIEVPQESLRQYGLTRQAIARKVNAATIELGGGSIRSDAGFISLRTTQDRELADAFRELVVFARPDGTAISLGDIATVREDFQNKNIQATMNGHPAMALQVFRGGHSSPTQVVDHIENYIAENEHNWGDAINYAIWNNRSTIYEDRVGLLVRNGLMGLLLVLVILGIFLRPQLAFWVTMGIPISFLGAFVILPFLGVSINMLSLFAFILVLGIVVDDAIVVGEAAFHRASAGSEQEEAAYEGVREVRLPVVFAVTTTLMVFIPMLFIPGVAGEFFSVIPNSVIPILIISIIESMLILPVHIAHLKKPEAYGRWFAWLTDKQQAFSTKFEQKAESFYRPLIRFVLAWRYSVMAASLLFLATASGLVMGRHIGFFFMPKIEGKTVTASIELPAGTSLQKTKNTVNRIEKIAWRIIGDESDVTHGIFSIIGTSGATQLNLIGSGEGQQGVNTATVEVAFIPPDERNLSSVDFARSWRDQINQLPDIDQLLVSYSTGPSSGKTLSFQLSHPRYETLQHISTSLANELRTIKGTIEVDQGFDLGTPEINLQLKPEGRALGLDVTQLAGQLRAKYYGTESFRQPRGRDELRIYVRATDPERQKRESFEQMLIMTEGGEIPLEEAAQLNWSRSPTSIERKNGRRIITVSGDVDDRYTTANAVSGYAQKELIPALQKQYPELTYTIGGEQESQRESLAKIFNGLVIAFLAMYALIATIFKSYLQPLLIFIAIPYGWAGAIYGHMLLGYDLTIVSILGMLALSGVVINDSLVLIYTINKRCEEGLSVDEAIEEGGLRRLRPVLLTSLTTFFGLSPMILETSIQARFLIPMAISLGIGVLFVTIITLLLVPSAYRIVEDFLAADHKSH